MRRKCLLYYTRQDKVGYNTHTEIRLVLPSFGAVLFDEGKFIDFPEFYSFISVITKSLF